MINRLFYWCVCMVLCCALAAPVAVAEQLIIVQIDVVLSPENVSRNPKPELQYNPALFDFDRSPLDGSVPPRGEADGSGESSRDQRLTLSHALLTDVVHVLEQSAQTLHGSPYRIIPIVVRITRDGDTTTRGTERSRTGLPPGPVPHASEATIPAVDLLTGKPASVRPEYMDEYRELICGAGYSRVSIKTGTDPIPHQRAAQNIAPVDLVPVADVRCGIHHGAVVRDVSDDRSRP